MDTCPSDRHVDGAIMSEAIVSTNQEQKFYSSTKIIVKLKTNHMNPVMSNEVKNRHKVGRLKTELKMKFPFYWTSS